MRPQQLISQLYYDHIMFLVYHDAAFGWNEKANATSAEKSEKSLNSIFYALLDLYRLTNDSTEDRRTTRSERFQH